MKVKELIARLEKFPKDALVYVDVVAKDEVPKVGGYDWREVIDTDDGHYCEEQPEQSIFGIHISCESLGTG